MIALALLGAAGCDEALRGGHAGPQPDGAARAARAADGGTPCDRVMPDDGSAPPDGAAPDDAGASADVGTPEDAGAGGDANFWTIAVLPDTQYYSCCYPDIFDAQTAWLADQQQARRIAFVLHEGDIVNDATDPRGLEWPNANHSLGLLDGVLAYVLVPGNHDYGDLATRDLAAFDGYYAAPVAHRPTFLGSFESGRIENSAHLLPAPGGEWLVIGLEFAPRDAVLGWADGVLTTYAATPAILLTHGYLAADGTRYDITRSPAEPFDPAGYFAPDSGANDGEQIWQKLVARHANVRFVFCGHALGAPVLWVDLDLAGLPVAQMLANYQTLPFGGSGYLRLIEFWPDEHEVRVKTYSPWLQKSLTDPSNDFTLPFSP